MSECTSNSKELVSEIKKESDVDALVANTVKEEIHSVKEEIKAEGGDEIKDPLLNEFYSEVTFKLKILKF